MSWIAISAAFFNHWLYIIFIYNLFIQIFISWNYFQQMVGYVMSPGGKKDLLDAKVICSAKNAANVIIDIPPQAKLPHIREDIFKIVAHSFDFIGAGNGTDIKTDEFNTVDGWFHQLGVVRIDPEWLHKLISWYRFALLPRCQKNGQQIPKTPMTNFFDFDPTFLKDNEAKIIELWTAWVNLQLSTTDRMFGLFSIWDGLKALMDTYNNTYFIGKLTIPGQYNTAARDFAIQYMEFLAQAPFANDAVPNPNFQYIRTKHYDMSFSKRNFGEDRMEIKKILNQPRFGQEHALPAMFPTYAGRLVPGAFQSIGSIWNDNGVTKVAESWILVPTNAIIEEQQENHAIQLIDNMRFGDFLEQKKIRW